MRGLFYIRTNGKVSGHPFRTLAAARQAAASLKDDFPDLDVDVWGVTRTNKAQRQTGRGSEALPFSFSVRSPSLAALRLFAGISDAALTERP